MTENLEVEKPQETLGENLLTAIETARAKLLRKIKRKRRKLVKFVERAGEDFETLTKVWLQSFVTAGLAAGLFVTTAVPITAASIPQFEIREVVLTPAEKTGLQQKLLSYLTKSGKSKKINPQIAADMVSKITNLKATTILEGKKIPQFYGEIATERHLKIYPGQKITEHLKNSEDFAKYHWTGMAPAPSAWGYFATDIKSTTVDLVEKEKYYLAIQTFSAQDWNQNWPELKEWYKFRKLLVYNPQNGAAVVGVVGDAGPAKYTGRAFGGSPEIMEALGLTQTKTQGQVLAFFLDDPKNLIPLGPLAE